MKMKTVAIYLCAFILILCTGCKSSPEVWDEIEVCKKRFNEDCSVMVVPTSKYKEIDTLYQKWLKD
jgi:hypothetical protein